MSIKLNGKEMSSHSALDLLRKESITITKVGLSFKNEKKKSTGPNSEGFTIKKSLISELCRSMDRLNADRIKFKLSGSPYILNRDLTLIMEVPRPEPKGLKRLLRRLGEWLVEKSE